MNPRCKKDVHIGLQVEVVAEPRQVWIREGGVGIWRIFTPR